jgi:hypothetical protein
LTRILACFGRDPHVLTRILASSTRILASSTGILASLTKILASLEFEGGSLNLLAFENQAATSNGSLEPKFDFMGLKT